MERYRIIDCHCDTLCELIKQGKELQEGDVCVSLPKMKANTSYLQFFALFVHDNEETPFRRANDLMAVYKRQLQLFQSDLVPVLNSWDAETVITGKKTGAMLTLENGRLLEGNVQNLYYFYEHGARAMGLTWNGANELCDGIGIPNGRGLTAFGREVVSAMNQLGMLVDVSHISEKGFWDVLEESSQPVMATHSNSRSVCRHKRNLTDEQIHALASQGGVIGLNLFPEFLSDGKTAGWEDCARHIRHIISVGGEDCIGLGSDFDGFPKPMPVSINGAEDYGFLFDKLKENGLSAQQIEKITYKNVLNLIKTILK